MDIDNINERNGSGYTALHIAASEGDAKLFKELLRIGADHTVTDKDGCTPLMVAAFCNQRNIVDILYKEGRLWNLNAKSIRGYTAIDLAHMQGHRRLVKRLINYGIQLYKQQHRPVISADHANDSSLYDCFKD